jgi:hypothetical protein
MDTPPSNQELILSGQQAIAGLLGSLIMVMRDPRKRSRMQKISAVLAGTASAVYLTEPIVGTVFNLHDPKYLLGFSFLFGCMGLRIIEIITDKIEKAILTKLEEKSK